MVTRVRDGKLHSLEGNKKHPVTKGSLCPKGQNLGKYVHSRDRVLYPMKRVGEKGDGEFERISWREALDGIAEEIRSRSTEYGTDSILQFDYAGTMGHIQRFFPSRFFNAIGASRISHTICSRAGDKALEVVYGSSLGMLPEEIEKCRLIVLWGMNPAWSTPHGYEILKRARKGGAKIYVIDPLRTASVELGVHLQIRPTTDAAFALGCINHIIENRLYDNEFISKNTVGFEKLVEIVKKFDMNRMAKLTGLGNKDMEDFIADFVSLRPSCIMMGYGMQRNRNGGEMIRAISMLPAMIGHTRGFFYSTDLEDFDMYYLEAMNLATRKKTYHNMVDMGKTLETDKVKMIFVYNSNPLATLPNQALVRKGFSRDDIFVVVHDLFLTDTADYADIVLPATSFLEHFDIHTSYFHQYVSINEKALDAPGEAKSNCELFRELAKTMKLPSKELYEEEQDVARKLVSKSKVVVGTFENLMKKGFLKLKVPDRSQYQTPSGKIEFFSEAADSDGLGGLPTHVEVSGKFPYQLLSPVHKHLLRSQYHQLRPDVRPVAYVNPEDADEESLEDGETVSLTNELGSWPVRVEVSDSVPRGVIVAYSALWPKLSDGMNVNFLTTDYVQKYGRNSALNSTFVRIVR